MLTLATALYKDLNLLKLNDIYTWQTCFISSNVRFALFGCHEQVCFLLRTYGTDQKNTL